MGADAGCIAGPMFDSRSAIGGDWIGGCPPAPEDGPDAPLLGSTLDWSPIDEGPSLIGLLDVPPPDDPPLLPTPDAPPPPEPLPPPRLGAPPPDDPPLPRGDPGEEDVIGGIPLPPLAMTGDGCDCGPAGDRPGDGDAEGASMLGRPAGRTTSGFTTGFAAGWPTTGPPMSGVPAALTPLLAPGWIDGVPIGGATGSPTTGACGTSEEVGLTKNDGRCPSGTRDPSVSSSSGSSNGAWGTPGLPPSPTASLFTVSKFSKYFLFTTDWIAFVASIS